jgi:uncharacterized membrane protein
MNKKLPWRIVVVLLVAAAFIYSVVKHETTGMIVMGILLLFNIFLLVNTIMEQKRKNQ